MACRRLPGGGTGDHGGDVAIPGLPPAGIDPPASRAARHRPASPGLRRRHTVSRRGRVDPGTGPITTLARLVTTCIRADGPDGLPGHRARAAFLLRAAPPTRPSTSSARLRRQIRPAASLDAAANGRNLRAIRSPALKSFPAAGPYPPALDAHVKRVVIALRAATPVSATVCVGTPPPTPPISEALVTSPSTAPDTVGRRQPPDTSRCPVRPAGPGAALPRRVQETGCRSRTHGPVVAGTRHRRVPAPGVSFVTGPASNLVAPPSLFSAASRTGLARTIGRRSG